MAKVIFQSGATFLEFNTKGIEEFPVGEGSVNISDDNDVSALVKVRNDILDLQFALDFYLSHRLPLAEVHITMIWSYLKRSQYFSSMLCFSKEKANSSSLPLSSNSKNSECVVLSDLLSRITRIRLQLDATSSMARTATSFIDIDKLEIYVPMIISNLNHLVSFMIALTESSPVSLRALTASARVHLVYSITILMLSGVSPSSLSSSAASSALGASVAGASTLVSSAPSGTTGFLNWLISFCPVWSPSMLGFPKMMQEFSFPGVFQTSGSSMLMTKAFPFLMVTLLMPVTGLSPILLMAFLNFFSPLLDFPSRWSSSWSPSSCSCWQFSPCTCSWVSWASGTFSAFTSSAITQSNIKILIHQFNKIMTSEQQYYEAKVFLSAYRDALSTLDHIASNRATVSKLHAYQKYLTASASRGEVIVDGNSLREGTYFNESRIRRLGLFSKSIFSDKLASFEGASTYEEVRKSLESYL